MDLHRCAVIPYLLALSSVPYHGALHTRRWKKRSGKTVLRGTLPCRALLTPDFVLTTGARLHTGGVQKRWRCC